jgi:hypothetical protein
VGDAASCRAVVHGNAQDRRGARFPARKNHFAITGKSMVFHDFPHGEAHEGMWISAGNGVV